MKKIVVILLMLVLVLVACSDAEPTATPLPAPPTIDAQATVDIVQATAVAAQAEAEDAQNAAANAEATAAALEANQAGSVELVSTGTPATEAELINTIWEWNSLVESEPAAQSVVPNPENYTITFLTDGAASIKADCNQVGATYTLGSDGSLSIMAGPSTKAFCGEESLDNMFLGLLASVTMAEMDVNGRLALASDTARMSFNNGGQLPTVSACNAAIDPSQFVLNTYGLPYSWQANCIPATPYDASMPPGPMGLPEHIQITFGVNSPDNVTYGTPVMYIIPVAAYREIWDTAGNDSVSTSLDQLTALLTDRPALFDAQIPNLPYEAYVVTGAGNNALSGVQGAYLDTQWGVGLRTLAQYRQDINPVTNQGLFYIEQGLTNDGEYLISFFYPVSTIALPNDIGIVSQEEMDQVNNDYNAYIQEKRNVLNGVPDYDFTPQLTLLDSVMASLDYVGPTEPQPPIDLPDPEIDPDTAYGRVIAPIGVNVRSGPSTAYAIVGGAKYGDVGEITGVSADGLWWVTPVDDVPNNQGWVSASYVEAFNAGSVPVMAAPPLPTPVPTPTPNPDPQISFWADRTVINQGECTTLRWNLNNIQAVWVYPMGQNYLNFPVNGQGSRQECPASTSTYEMRVLMRDGSIQFRQITVQVNPGNPLQNTIWSLNTIRQNEVLVPNTVIVVDFGFNGGMSGNGGCNQYNGTYSVNGNYLYIGSLTKSQASCSAEIDSQEQLYINLLQSARTFRIEGNELIVYDGSGQQILRYTRAG